jgi:hypothetical protein
MIDRMVGWVSGVTGLGAVPRGWSVSTGVAIVDVTDELGATVQQLVDATCRTELLGAGRDAKHRGHVALRVLSVRRIENVPLFRAFRSVTARFADEFAELGRPLPHVSTATADAAGAAALDAALGIDRARGESLLFHGTRRDVAEVIAKTGFEERVSAQGMFGLGIYFGDASSKADEYAGPGARGSMILARTWLGDPYVALASQSSFRRPPCIVGHSRVMCDHPRFTSLVAATGADDPRSVLTKHREFVLYAREQAYPELIVEFERVAATAANNNNNNNNNGGSDPSDSD